jgi:hypothetical protein
VRQAETVRRGHLRPGYEDGRDHADLPVGGAPGVAGVACHALRSRCKSLIMGPRLTTFGFPSDMVLVSGLHEGTGAAADNWIGALTTSISRLPHVSMDVCAALE